MKSLKDNSSTTIQTEAQIAATYKNFVKNPKIFRKQPISDFHLSISVNNLTETQPSKEGFKTDRVSNDDQHYGVSLITPQSMDLMKRPNSSRSNLYLSKAAAEYQEIPFRNTNKEYELFQKLFESKTTEIKGNTPKYEKKNIIQEIIENEYNFNKYGEESPPKRRKSSIKPRTPKTPMNTNINNFNAHPVNLRNKIVFSFQTKEENPISIESIKRPKKDKIFFESLKEKYFEKLKQIFHENNIQESQKIAKEDAEKILNDFYEYIDRSNQEKDDLTLQVKTSMLKFIEANRMAETLKVKLKLLEEKHLSLTNECSEMRSKLISLNKFEEIYTKFNKKLLENFPDGSLDKFFQKFEYLENVCLELTKRRLELEDDNITLEKNKQNLTKSYENTINNLYKESNEKEKFIKSLKEAQDSKNLEFEENFSYKSQYMKLFNQIMELYIKWSKDLSIYSFNNFKDKDVPNKSLNTPEEILTLLDKILVISTPQSAQAYIRKMVSSAVRLIRKFFPEKINESYDPDKVYDYISEYIEKIVSEIKKQKNEIIFMKQKNEEKLKKIQRKMLTEREKKCLEETKELIDKRGRRKALK